MPTQMRRGTSGTPTAAKAGTRVTKWAVPSGRFFRPRSGGGIAAHGMPQRVESPREAKDRELG